ncbi:MAG TPA: ornithine cyclodeaminase family protein [Chloroflexota bacterium]|jgi:ornithine cyclodeaminase
MSVLVLTHQNVEDLLPMARCIEVMAEALAGLHRGEWTQPLRSVYPPPNANGIMAWMPAHRGGKRPIFGMKVLCVMPGNPSRGLDGHQGAVLLMDGLTGEPRAMVHASAVTAIRTAAVSAVATRLLAREDARELAIIGAGVQARRHLEAMACVRPIERVRVASRTLAGAQRFVDSVRRGFSGAIEAVGTVAEAVQGAHIVVTATTARTPVLRREWLAPGTHVNAVGASQRTHQEIDAATVVAASLFVDRRQSVENEAADFRQAIEEGLIPVDHVRAELGELLVGACVGRQSADEITLFRSLGLAVEDVAAALYVVEAAEAAGVGSRAPW